MHTCLMNPGACICSTSMFFNHFSTVQVDYLCSWTLRKLYFRNSKRWSKNSTDLHVQNIDTHKPYGSVGANIFFFPIRFIKKLKVPIYYMASMTALEVSNCGRNNWCVHYCRNLIRNKTSSENSKIECSEETL